MNFNVSKSVPTKKVGGVMKLSGDLHDEAVSKMQEFFLEKEQVAINWRDELDIVDYRDKVATLNVSVRQYEEQQMYEYMDDLGNGNSIPEEHLFFSLPMEVQLMVSEHMDTQTLLTCCLLSAKFRDFVQTTSKNYFHTVRVRIGATGNIALEIVRENQEPEYFGVGYEVTWSSTSMRPSKGSNGQLTRVFSTKRCPTFQTPCPTSPVCLLKSLLPASSVQYLQIIPCAKDGKQPSLFEDAADIAEYYMDSYVIVELPKNPGPAVITTVLSRKIRLLFLCNYAYVHASSVFKDYYTRKTPDVLVVLEDKTVTIEPDYEELLEELLGDPFPQDLDRQFRMIFTDRVKFDSFKQKFMAAQDNKRTMHSYEYKGGKVYWIVDHRRKHLVFHDNTMCIMLVRERDVDAVVND